MPLAPPSEADPAPAPLTLSERSYAAIPRLHRHSYYQLFFPQHGALRLHAADARLLVGPASWVLLPPGAEHVFWSEVPTSCLVVDLAAPSMLLDEDAPHAEELLMRPLSARLTALAALLQSELRTGGCAEPLVAEALAGYLSAAVRLALRPGDAAHAPPPARAPAARARAYLEAHAFGPLSLAEVAAAAGTSVAHLQRSFRAAYGLTVIEQLQTLRVRRAQALLCEGDMPVEAVAAAVGFASPSYFTRLFTRLVGTSPARYRSRRDLMP